MGMVARLFGFSSGVAVALLVAVSAGLCQDSATVNIRDYTRPFGENPYLPSQAKSAFNGFLDPAKIPSAEYCGYCHQVVHQQWRESAHSNAFRTPWYKKNVQLLINEKGIEYTRHCEGCHNPMVLFSGALVKDSKIPRPTDEEGVTCIACHAIQQIQNTSGTGSYVMGIPAVMVREDGTPIPGEAPPQEIMARPDLHRRAVMRDIYRSPEFCATCHKAAVPTALNGYKWMRAFSVYDEWQQSSWSQQTPLPFYKKDTASTCQDCHMPRVKVGEEFGAKNGTIASHRWVGANTAIPFLYGYDEQMKQVESFLKDALAIDVFGLRKVYPQDDTLIAPIDRSRFSLMPSDTVILDVVIQNKKIGHSLVPEQRDFYEAWVELQVTDANGQTIFHSGYLDQNGRLEPGAHSYTNRLIGREGNLLDLHQVWDTRIKAYDNTILPGRSDVVRYQFRIPTDARGPLKIAAKVNYRRFRGDFTDWVFGQRVQFPIFELAQKDVAVELGMNKPSENQAKSDLPRWNNYGIALLDEQEYLKSLEAFRQTVKLDPAYVDGYINMGIALTASGNYRDAHASFDEALKLSPGNVRAQAYKGLAYRQEFRLPEAIAWLRPVTAKYPRVRQIRQELAYAYYLQGNYAAAREQYEALQAIDPDDLTMLRYLSSTYEKLGMHDKAAELGKVHADHLDDPGVIYLAQEYWRSHPELAREVLPFHTHGDVTKDIEIGVKKLLKPSLIWPYEQ